MHIKGLKVDGGGVEAAASASGSPRPAHAHSRSTRAVLQGGSDTAAGGGGGGVNPAAEVATVGLQGVAVVALLLGMRAVASHAVRKAR